MLAPVETTVHSWPRQALHWVRTRIEAWAACRELDDCREATRLAQDLGLPLSDLRHIALRGPDGAREMIDMLTALKIDPAALDRDQPSVMRDLRHHCCVCDTRAKCREELASGHAAESYRNFCPNAETLDAVRSNG
jgi:hypothetical protein